jgi:hypothetical protein
MKRYDADGRIPTLVTFVMDYLQLGFSGYGFNMNSWPTITIQNRTLAHEDDGYRDALCSLIGKTLTAVDEYLDQGLILQFENGSSISLSLRVGRDFPCPEVADFHGLVPNILMVWLAGEEP